MQKFFVNLEQIHTNTIEIVGEDVNHIKNVLRYKCGEEVLIGNENTGETYYCKIQEIAKEKILFTIIKKIEQTNEPETYIHVFQGLPKADKMEHIIQKGTEIGVSEFTPVSLSRTIVKLEEKEKIRKIERWQKIAETAAKQCKRDMIPKVNYIQNLKNLYEIFKEYDIVLVAYEDEKENSLKREIQEYKSLKEKNNKIAIIVGPEGGLEQEEIDMIKQFGGKAVTLGKRILRTETAPLVMATIILYELEE